MKIEEFEERLRGLGYYVAKIETQATAEYFEDIEVTPEDFLMILALEKKSRVVFKSDNPALRSCFYYYYGIPNVCIYTEVKKEKKEPEKYEVEIVEE